MRDEEPTDESLLAMFRETGNAEPLDILLRRHLPRVRTMIGQIVLNDSDADDLTQEIFLRAVRGLSQFTGRSRFSTWLYRVAINMSRSYLSRRGRVLPAHNGECLEPAAALHDGPPQQAAQRELETAVHHALAALSDKLRAAIVLVHFQGLSVQEAAEIEGCTRATMYWRVHEARRCLKGQLKQYLP